MSNQIATVGGVKVYKLDGTVSYVAALAIDADGSPHAYAPKPLVGLDYLANAGGPGNWYGIATDNNGKPFVQGPNDPAPGYFVSTTALEDPRYATSDPRRYVDSEKVPYIVLPGGNSGMKAWGCKLGNRGRATNQKNGKTVDFIVGDLGPRNKLGEASIAFAEALGLSGNPKKGGTDEKIILYEVWC